MATNNLNFKEIWQQQEVAKPDVNQLAKKLNKYRRKNIFQLYIVNILSVVTILVIGWMWYAIQPAKLTTQFGILLTIAAIIFFIFYYNKMLTLNKNLKNNVSNKNYLNNLVQIKAKQKHLQTKILSIYFAVLSVGVALYMFEFTQKMTLNLQLFVYGLTGCWFLFNWFYLRPKVVKQQQTKIDELIDSYNRINNNI